MGAARHHVRPWTRQGGAATAAPQPEVWPAATTLDPALQSLYEGVVELSIAPEPGLEQLQHQLEEEELALAASSPITPAREQELLDFSPPGSPPRTPELAGVPGRVRHGQHAGPGGPHGHHRHAEETDGAEQPAAAELPLAPGQHAAQPGQDGGGEGTRSPFADPDPEGDSKGGIMYLFAVFNPCIRSSLKCS